MPQPAVYLDGKRVPDGQVQSALATGRAEVSRSQKFELSNAAGDVVVAPAGELGSYLSRGFSVDSEEAVKSRARRIEQNTLTGMGITAVEGAADAVTLGLSTKAAVGLLGDEYRQDAQARRDVNPITHTVSGIVTDAALVLGTGGGSLAAKGALKVGAKALPGAVAARGAAVAGKAAERLALTRGASAGVAKALGVTAEAGLGGAAAGAGLALTDSALDDTELTAEKVLAGMQGGAMMGAAGGLGLSAVGRVAAKAARKVASIAPEGLAAGGLKVKAMDLYGKASGKLLGDSDGIVRKVTALDDEGGRIRNHWQQQDRLREDFTTRIGKDIDDMLAADSVVRDAYAGELKTLNVRDSIRRGADVVPAMQQHADTMLAKLDAVGEEAFSDGIGKAKAKSLRADFEALKADVGSLDEAAAYVRFDKFKRSLQRQTKSLALSARRVSGDVKIRQTQEAVKFVESLQEQTRKFLENDELFGQAAVNQRQRNALMHDFAGTAEDVERRFSAQTSENDELAPWFERNKRRADLHKTDSFIGDLADYKNAPEIDQTTRNMDARVEMLGKLIESGAAPPGPKMDALKAAHEASIRMRRSLGEASQVFQDVDMIRQVQAMEGRSVMANAAGGGALTGAVLGGFGGAAVGAAVSAVSKPSKVAMQLAAMESLSGRAARVDQSIKHSVARVINRSIRKADLSKSRPKRAQAAGAAVRAADSVSREKRDHRRKVERFKTQRDELKNLQLNPVLSQNHVSETLGQDMSEAAPHVSMHIASKHIQAVGFLASKLPASPSLVGRSLQPHLYDRDPTPAEMQRFERYTKVINQPLSVLDDLANGSLTTEAVETLRAIYPKLLEQIQEETMEHLAQTARPMPYRETLQLGMLLDIPAHPTLEPGFIQRQQERMKQAAETNPPQTTPSKSTKSELAENSATTTQKLIS